MTRENDERYRSDLKEVSHAFRKAAEKDRRARRNYARALIVLAALLLIGIILIVAWAAKYGGLK